MKKAAQSHILPSSAYLCQDCNALGNNAVHCPACASEVLMGLAGVLNRMEKLAGSKLLPMAKPIA